MFSFRNEQGIVRPLAVSAVLPAVSPVFFLLWRTMPCHMAPPTDSPAPFLFCFHRIETSPALERTVICHFERTRSYRNVRHLLSRQTLYEIIDWWVRRACPRLRGRPHAHTPRHGAPENRLRNAETDLRSVAHTRAFGRDLWLQRKSRKHRRVLSCARYRAICYRQPPNSVLLSAFIIFRYIAIPNRKYGDTAAFSIHYQPPRSFDSSFFMF